MEHNASIEPVTAKILINTWFYDLLGKRSYSQSGEDMILRSIFDDKKEGFYVDVGAFHPKLYSNTYYFYKRGWRGINIEPNPGANFGIRKGDINLKCGIGL